LITNGFEDVQHKKLTHSRIQKYFEEVITSEASNSLKPHKDIFEYALKVAGANNQESIMLGDDLEADIIGAYKAGLDQVFINYNGKKPDFRPTFTVHSLKELEEIF
jgi:putative hydrolase of the HAD superfamily